MSLVQLASSILSRILKFNLHDTSTHVRHFRSIFVFKISFSGASLNIFGSCLHSQLQITVFYCNRISSFSFYEFYNNLVYSLEYVFLVFDILRPAADETKLSVAREKKPLLPKVVVLSQLHCTLYYFVACKHLDYFVFFC